MMTPFAFSFLASRLVSLCLFPKETSHTWETTVIKLLNETPPDTKISVQDSSKQVKPPLRQNISKYFEINPDISIETKGQIGERMKINISQDTKASFDFENISTLNYYKGNKEPIIEIPLLQIKKTDLKHIDLKCFPDFSYSQKICLPQKHIQFVKIEHPVQVGVLGQIGNRTIIKKTSDTEASFNFENISNLNYKGNEYQIVQSIDIGWVSLPLGNNLPNKDTIHHKECTKALSNKNRNYTKPKYFPMINSILNQQCRCSVLPIEKRAMIPRINYITKEIFEKTIQIPPIHSTKFENIIQIPPIIFQKSGGEN